MSSLLARRIDHFFAPTSTRIDGWRALLAASRRWQSDRDAEQKRAVVEAFEAIAPLEDYFAYPSAELLAATRQRLDDNDANGTRRQIERIANQLMSRGYRHSAEAFDIGEDTGFALGERISDVVDGSEHRPYFEVMVVTSVASRHFAASSAEMRRLRRDEDDFCYETIFVGSFEDAILGALLNPDIQAVAIYDGFPFETTHTAPVLTSFLSANPAVELSKSNPEDYPLLLARALKQLRPELDLYLLSDRDVESVAGRTESTIINHVFYGVEEPLELHFALLEGVRKRFETPFFDNLKHYAARPIETFHALPVARGKSVFKSNWIRDMGQFYGMNLFLAESSATTGGLDSLLEPTGNIKKAQDMAARAFGADHVYFVTNGTSTSNKMVHQGILRPGDIVLVDRNCHKSHHYGMVLSGAQPLYVEAFPLTELSMYGAVPLRAMKAEMLKLKAEGKLDRLRMVVLTNCTFDGHVYHTQRVMEELLAIKPDLVFLWDEAWFGFAYFHPFYRKRTAMGARAAMTLKRRSGDYARAFAEQVEKLGRDLDPADPRLLDMRLTPDPEMMRLRIYQCNSTHKSMSALRQASMVLVGDEDHDEVVSMFHEAVFTHASTSPNQQIIASLDIARRQMELEGYGLVVNAVGLALVARRQINAHPLISRYFRMVDLDEMVPAGYRGDGMARFCDDALTWAQVMNAIDDDEFWLDPTRMTLVCGSAGFDGTQFKKLLADEFNIQVNKTSRNSVLLQTNINNNRSDIGQLIKVLLTISQRIEDELNAGGDDARAAFAARVRSLMDDVPDLPNFSRFAPQYRENDASATTEGDMRSAFFAGYWPERAEYLKLDDPAIESRLKDGPELISANFVIPYPPGFPIMVPGQVITHETIEFMRKLDVKEIHGFDAVHGLKLLKPA